MSDSYAAVIFDMDGVVTDTARVHRRAWTQLFDEYLAAHSPAAARFTDEDYLALVDGRVRIDGVTAFLASRDISLPMGQPTDARTAETAWGLANRKNEIFVDAVHREGVDVFDSTLAFIRRLREAHVRTALVTSSRNAELVLATINATELFDACVDGVTTEELGLAGKPDPATFLEAARRLGASPGMCVVVEDARAGVQAGRAGRFGLVIGVARHGEADALRAAGADVVVADLGDLPDAVVHEHDPWVLAFRGFDPGGEGRREALLTVGNGYVATRGAMGHTGADSVHYPGTYVAGVYNRLVSHVDGHAREDESIVNLPNWLSLTLRCDGGTWLAPATWSFAAHRVALDLRTAVLHRDATLIDPDGRRTRLVERRFASMADQHTLALQLRLTPQNWRGRLEVRSLVDGDVKNTNVAEYRLLADRHLENVDRRRRGAVACLVTETSSSRIRIAVAAATRFGVPGGDRTGSCETDARPIDDADVVGDEFGVDVTEGQEVVIDKIVGIATSRDHAITEPALTAIETASTAASFDSLLEHHAARWVELWRRFHVELEGDSEQLRAVRAHLVHLLQSLSPHSADLDVGVPPRGLHGEGYRGHIFWDELFVFPLLDYRLPELTQSLLQYRVRRLPAARYRAREVDARGALFPWQSGSDGREETPRELFNPRSGRWMPDNSRREYHVNLAIAFNVWKHWQVTNDIGFLVRHGAELLVETARFFAAYATSDAGDDRFDLRGVMGPDEFHDGYPDRPGEGIDNNAYVNVMASWALARACELGGLLGPRLGDELWSGLAVDGDELARWDDVSRRLRVPFLPNGLLAQFEGFEHLEELDLERYRKRYGNIGRLDLILEAEGDSTNRYQVSKQADVLMLFYLFTTEELDAVFARLSYRFDPTTIPATVDHYLERTTHGSTLSRVAHAWVLARTDRARSWRLFEEALGADLGDTQGRTTYAGVHLGAMAGSVDILERCYTGLEARDEVLWFNPQLPDELAHLEMELRYRDHVLTIHVDHHDLRLHSAPGPAQPIAVGIPPHHHELAPGQSLRIPLRRRTRHASGRALPPTVNHAQRTGLHRPRAR